MILVTGAAGYIGKNLCNYLVDKGLDVLMIDKNLRRITDLNHQERGLFLDINDLDDSYLPFDSIICIVHLAATSGIATCENDLYTATRNNILASIKVSEWSRVHKIPLIIASSQAAKDPLSNIYAYMKFVNEITVDNVNDSYDKKLAQALRFSNVFGGKYYLQKKSSVVAQFIKAYTERKPLEIDGDGKQIRDFIHVDEVCRAIYLCIKKWDRVSNSDRHPIDICTGIPRTIENVAKMFKNPEIMYRKSERSGIESNIGDPKLAREIFHFLAEDKLEEYISKEKW